MAHASHLHRVMVPTLRLRRVQAARPRAPCCHQIESPDVSRVSKGTMAAARQGKAASRGLVHHLSLEALPCRHRFSAKKKSHGWCDFGPSSTVLDPKQGFLQDETLLVTADIQTLQESISFARDGELSGGSNLAGVGTGEVLGGKYTWKLHNFSMFRETVRAWCKARPWHHCWPAEVPPSCKQSASPGPQPSQLGH